MIILYIFLANLILSLISLASVVFLSINKKNLQVTVNYLVAFSIGTMLGGAFFHLILEGLEVINKYTFVLIFLTTTLIFFLLERVFSFVHCHKVDCSKHQFGYLNLIGDFFHNFTDGIALATSFLTSVGSGISTTLALSFHELPQEIGDFGVLVKAGFKVKKAIVLNVIVSLSSLLGSVTAVLIYNISQQLAVFLMPVSAASMVYIAVADLIPVVYKESKTKLTLVKYISVSIVGVLLMYLLTLFEI